MFTWIGRSVLLGLLLLQSPEDTIDTLDEDYRRTRTGSDLAMITLIALHEDGTPVRGFISCAGEWYKHEDGQPELAGWGLPFRTDSRGAIAMNPHLDDEWIACWSQDKGKRGTVIVEFSADDPSHVVEFVLDKESE